jgi:hypothetical protein
VEHIHRKSGQQDRVGESEQRGHGHEHRDRPNGGVLQDIFDSGFKIIFFVSFLLRASSLLLIRGIIEEAGTPVRKIVEVLRSMKAWTSMLGNHPLLQFFLQ